MRRLSLIGVVLGCCAPSVSGHWLEAPSASAEASRMGPTLEEMMGRHAFETLMKNDPSVDRDAPTWGSPYDDDSAGYANAPSGGTRCVYVVARVKRKKGACGEPCADCPFQQGDLICDQPCVDAQECKSRIKGFNGCSDGGACKLIADFAGCAEPPEACMFCQ